MPIIRPEPIDQTLRQLLIFLRAKHVIIEDASIRCLTVSRNLARFIQKSVEERTLDPGTFVRKRIFTAHDSGHLADHDCRFIKNRPYL